MKATKTLILVYNADGGRWNTMMDIAHKIISPSSYPCQLCDLTHGIWTMRPEWNYFIKNFEGSLSFLHRDKYISEYGQKDMPELPTILKQDASGLSTFMDVVDIRKCKDVKTLIVEIEKRWTNQ